MESVVRQEGEPPRAEPFHAPVRRASDRRTKVVRAGGRAPFIMTRILGIILLLVGVFLVYKGLQREDSLAGKLDKAGSEVANTVDGGNRVPNHTLYLVGGGVLIVAGAAVALKRPSRAAI